MSFWTTLITFGFWCECPNSFPSDLGHFEGLAFFQYFSVLGLDPGGHRGMSRDQAVVLRAVIGDVEVSDSDGLAGLEGIGEGSGEFESGGLGRIGLGVLSGSLAGDENCSSEGN